MKCPMVSVIIASYNYAHFLDQAIESVLSQNYPQEKIEIIVVDDGSTDNTKEVIARFQDKIKYVFKQNGGQASAFNTGFQHSTGDIIFLLDADDVFYAGKLAEVTKIYNKYDCKAVFTSLLLFGDGNEPHEFVERKYSLKFISKIDEYLYKMSYKNVTYYYHFLAETSAQSYKRDLLEKMLPCPESLGPQTDFYLHALTLISDEIYLLDRNLSGYRKHTQSISFQCHNGNIEKFKNEIDRVRFIMNFIKQKPDNKEKTQVLTKSINNYIYLLMYMLEKNRNDKLKALYYILKYKTSPVNPLAKLRNKLRYIHKLVQ